jgi:hypothetical protein
MEGDGGNVLAKTAARVWDLGYHAVVFQSTSSPEDVFTPLDAPTFVTMHAILRAMSRVVGASGWVKGAALKTREGRMRETPYELTTAGANSNKS